MKVRIKEASTPRSRIQRILRWSQRLLLMTGTIALGYVGLTVLDARLYQASAKRVLDSQIEGVHQRPTTQPEAALEKGEVLGRMDIPRLGLSVVVLQGTSSHSLRLGAGHIEGTPLPGEAGNIGIAGHRDTFFRPLKDIHQDDEIQLQTAAGLLRYEVDWAKVVAPDDMSVLAPSAESALTLVTCYPFYFVGPSPNRFVVHARQHTPQPPL